VTDPAFTRILIWGVFGSAIATFAGLVFTTAPYGRHVRGGWGPTVPSRVGWIAMESPAVLAFVAFYLLGPHRADPAPLALLALWQTHYVHRTFVFPFAIRSTGKTMPASIAIMGAAFNLVNAWTNARWISALGEYPSSWIFDARFVLGAIVFVTGLTINVRADRRLMALRRPGETGYKIPRGGLHEYVSSPNYLGEILEWFGWAMATWSLAGLSFAVYTVANLLPRALANHAWNRKTFPDYPLRRKALLPFLLLLAAG
jgi:protein-S-isoprenylcysteine O-methyltransferase Ste14